MYPDIMLALTTMIAKLRKYFILSLAMHNYLPVFFLKRFEIACIEIQRY